MGITDRGDGIKNLCTITEKLGQKVNYTEGSVNSECNVLGTYLHGIFEEEDFAYTFINKYVSQLECHEKVSYKEYKMNEYDKLCDILEENIDMDLVNSIINGD